MRIFHYIYDHTGNPWVAGGGAVRAYELNRRLARTHDVTIISGRYPGAKDYRTPEGLSYHFAGAGANSYPLSTFCYAAGAWRHLRENQKRDRPDIVVEDFAPYNPIFSYRVRPDAVIQVHQREGILHLKKKKFLLLGAVFYLIEKYYPKRFRNRVVISELARKTFCLDDATVIPNGFDPALTGAEPSDGGFILFLGRFNIREKGLNTLAKAMEKAKTKKTLRLVLAGGGKEDAGVRRLFAFRDAEFPGYVSGASKTKLLSSCSFLVLPSRIEGQPLALLEAAACGKPAVTSDIPALEFAARAGFALRFKKGDPASLAEKIETLMADKALRQDMGRKAREFAADYNWDAIAARYEESLLEMKEESGR